jgi:N-acetylglutamate synthase-like GNAT family acetyltransferase
VEHQIRHARITDLERIFRLIERALNGRSLSPEGADLLRELVYGRRPSGLVLVAGVDREVIGTAVLTLRPSVRQPVFVGSVDLVVVDPGYADESVMDALIDELLRSAGNKGCVVVEAALPDHPELLARWQGHGFRQAGPRFERLLTPVGAGRT